ncbi:uncharacterized protein LOC108164084 [Drosophila miranda]|uniref:uncharacterized protein LOC108164084 n=1 Tax=Drosophila miranda TaxID=7229 RepID=UPI00143F5384|nr:uncharacterized protein LOC108164084 [Drosophila miranda]
MSPSSASTLPPPQQQPQLRQRRLLPGERAGCISRGDKWCHFLSGCRQSDSGDSFRCRWPGAWAWARSAEQLSAYDLEIWFQQIEEFGFQPENGFQPQGEHLTTGCGGSATSPRRTRNHYHLGHGHGHGAEQGK